MGIYELVPLVGMLILLGLEPVIGRNRLQYSRLDRWSNNVGLAFINEALRFVFPLGLALIAVEMPWPGLNAGALGPIWGAVLAFFLMDFCLYWLHRASHRLGWLWRLHRLHHTDLDLDLTTNFRHHPGEVGINLIVISGLVGLLGFTPAHLLPYLLVQRCISLLSHSNVAFPVALERHLGELLVTPRVHQIHHSALQPETDSNYGQVFTLWDRLFRTYISPDTVPCPARFGLERFRAGKDQRLAALLSQPMQ